MGSKVLTDTFDACRLLGVSESSIRRFVNNGSLVPVQRIAGLFVFNTADVLGLRDARAVDPSITTIKKLRPTVGERMAQQLQEAR